MSSENVQPKVTTVPEGQEKTCPSPNLPTRVTALSPTGSTQPEPLCQSAQAMQAPERVSAQVHPEPSSTPMKADSGPVPPGAEEAHTERVEILTLNIRGSNSIQYDVAALH